MSLSYVAKFSSDATIDVIARDMAQEFSYRLDPFHCGRTPLIPTVTLVATDFNIAVSEIDSLGRQMMFDDYNTMVDRSARFFVLDTFSTQSEDGRRIVEVTNYLLAKYSGDLILLFNEEQPLLIRTKSDVVINSSAGFWNSSTRAAIRAAFSEAPLQIM